MNNTKTFTMTKTSVKTGVSMLNDTDPNFNQALLKKKQISDLVDVNQSGMGEVVIEKALIADLGPTKETSSDEEVSFVQ